MSLALVRVLAVSHCRGGVERWPFPKAEGDPEAIRRSVELHGYPPTVGRVCTAAGISSTSVVIYNLRRLEEQGYLQRNPETSRGIRLLDPAEQQPQSNPPWWKCPSWEGSPPVPRFPSPTANSPSSPRSPLPHRDILPDEGEIYALEVRGNSMIDALINDGDIVIMRHQTVANNGDLVAVWLKRGAGDHAEALLPRGEPHPPPARQPVHGAHLCPSLERGGSGQGGAGHTSAGPPGTGPHRVLRRRPRAPVPAP